MVSKRKAAIYYGKGDLRIEEIDMPTVGPDQVLVKIRAVGVCGSDVHLCVHGAIGDLVNPVGHINGHECAGEIAAVGENVKDRYVGQRVAIEPGEGCGECFYCKSGKYNLCPHMDFMGHPNPEREGAYTEYTVCKAGYTYPIEDNVSFEEAAMVEPMAVAMQILKNSQVKAGDNIAILGAGTIGMCTLLAAQAFGCNKIFVTDITQYRVDAAKKFGATMAINAETEDWKQIIKDATGGLGVDVAIDVAGCAEIYHDITEIVRRGGMVNFTAMTSDKYFEVNMFEVIDKELKISSVFRYDNVFEQALRLMAAGRVDMKKLITHKFPLEQINEAMRVADQKLDNCIKVCITMGDE